MQQELISALYETLLMVSVAGFFTLLIGLPVGLILNLTRPGHVFAQHSLYKILSSIIHSTQSFPYVILMIMLMPITSSLLGKEEHWAVAILPLSFATIPYFAHQCEQAFNQVSIKLIELTSFLGASTLQIILKVLLPETWPHLVHAFTSSLVQLVSYSAIAGLLGASGLGSLAIQKGYPTFQASYIFATVLTLLVLIQGLKSIGQYFLKKGNSSSTLLKANELVI